jgi:hypothetical protein
MLGSETKTTEAGGGHPVGEAGSAQGRQQAHEGRMEGGEVRHEARERQGRSEPMKKMGKVISPSIGADLIAAHLEAQNPCLRWDSFYTDFDEDEPLAPGMVVRSEPRRGKGFTSWVEADLTIHHDHTPYEEISRRFGRWNPEMTPARWAEMSDAERAAYRQGR